MAACATRRAARLGAVWVVRSGNPDWLPDSAGPGKYSNVDQLQSAIPTAAARPGERLCPSGSATAARAPPPAAAPASA
eukprot:244196-Prymnesium_polylepis.1